MIWLNQTYLMAHNVHNMARRLAVSIGARGSSEAACSLVYYMINQIDKIGGRRRMSNVYHLDNAKRLYKIKIIFNYSLPIVLREKRIY